MKYLKVFTDFIEQIEPYSDAERGRLFTAMLEYARSSKEPAFKGNERFIWNSIKVSIDRDRETYDRMVGRAQSAVESRKAKTASEKPHRNDIARHRNDIAQGNNDNAQDKDKDKDNTPPTPSKGEAASGESYISTNLVGMTAGNWEELRSYLDDGITMELIHHAVDEAAANGKRTWAYVRGVLNRFLTEGISSVEQAKNTKVIKQPEKQKPKYRWVGEDDDC